MVARADWVAVTIALAAHAVIVLGLFGVHDLHHHDHGPIEVELVPHEPIESAARQPPPAAAPLPRATQTATQVDRPKPVVHEPKIVHEAEPVDAPQTAVASTAPATSKSDGGVEGGSADGVKGGVAGGVKGGVADGKPSGDALVGPSFGVAYLHNAPPRYPPSARKLNLEGTTTLRVSVSADGHPTSVKVHTSSGVDALDEAAVEAVQHWSFVPAKQGDKPIAAEVNVPVRFRLDSSASE